MAGTPMFLKDSPVVNRAYGVFDYAAGDVTGKVLFTLPKGAIILPGSSTLCVETVLSGGTPSLNIGTSGDTNALFDTADITEATAAQYAIVLATLNAGVGKAPLTADTDIIATETGSATAGKFHVVVNFIHSNDPTTIG